VFKQGDYPYWIKSMLGGVQFYDNAQFSIDYPLYFLRYLNYGAGVESLRTITLISLLHVLILSVNTYILARVVKPNFIGSFICAIIMLCCVNTTLYAKWIVIISAYAWFPLFLAGLIRLINNPDKFSGPLLILISLLGFTANPAQPIIHALFVTLIVVSYSLIFHSNKKKLVLSSAKIGILGLGLTGFVLIPVLLNMEEMIRWVGKGLNVVGNQKIPREAFTEGLTTTDIHKVIFDTNLDPVGSIYLGPLGVALLLCGIIYFIKRFNCKSYHVPFLIILLFGLFSSFGDSLGFNDLNYHIPFINKIREPERHAILFVSSAIIFINIGFAHLNKFRNKYTLALILLYTVVFILLLLDRDDSQVNLTLAIYAALFIIVGIILSKSPIKKYTSSILIFTLLLMYTQTTKKAITTEQNRWDYYNINNLSSMDILSKLSLSIDKFNSRITYHDKNLDDGKWSMNSLYYGLRSFQSQHVPIPFEQFKDMNNKDHLWNYRRLLGSKYHIYNKQAAVTQSSLKHHLSNELYSVYIDNLGYDKYYFPSRIVKTQENINNINSILPKHPKNTLFLDVQNSAQYIISAGKLKNTIELIEESHNLIKLHVFAEEPTLLLLNEYYNKNWKGVLDNLEQPLIKANINQIAIEVPQGIHVIEFKYQPKFVNTLWLIKWLTILIIIANLIYGRKISHR